MVSFFNKPSIYDYKLSKDLLIYQLSHHFQCFKCYKISTVSEIEKIVLLLPKLSKTLNFSSNLLFISSLNSFFLWIGMKLKEKTNILPTFAKLEKKLFPFLRIVKNDELRSIFFFNPVFSNPNYKLIENEKSHMFQICDSRGQEVYIDYIRPPKREGIEKIFDGFQNIFKFLKFSNEEFIIYGFLKKKSEIGLNVLILSKLSEKKEKILKFLKKQSSTANFLVDNISLRMFRNLLRKSELSNQFKVNREFFLNLLESFDYEKSIDVIQRNSSLDLLSNKIESIEKITRLSYIINKEIILFIITKRNIPYLDAVLRKHYLKSSKFFLSYHDPALYSLLKKQLHIENLRKIHIIAKSDLKRIMKLIRENIEAKPFIPALSTISVDH